MGWKSKFSTDGKLIYVLKLYWRKAKINSTATMILDTQTATSIINDRWITNNRLRESLVRIL